MSDNPEDPKKRKKGSKKKFDPNNPFAFNPFEDMDEEERERFNNQFKNMFGQFGEIFSKQFENVDISKILGDMMNQIDPENLANMMNNEEVMKKFREEMGDPKNIRSKKPMVFGMNLKIGPDGMPKFEPFGNIRKQTKSGTEDSYEVQDTREPLTDIIEEDDEIIVVAEMPGCVKEKIELKATEDTITIIGNDEEGICKFKTTLELPSQINPDRAKANFKNGILEVKLQKIQNRFSGKKINID